MICAACDLAALLPDCEPAPCTCEVVEDLQGLEDFDPLMDRVDWMEV